MVERPNALLILNPPDGNQGFLFPQISTSNRLLMKPVSPDEDGLVVFDKDERVFYHWKNNLWSRGMGNEASFALMYDATSGRLSAGPGNEVSLAALKEVPPINGNVGKILSNNGTSLQWTNAGADNQDLTLTGKILSLTNDPTPVDLNLVTLGGAITGQLSNTALSINSINSTHLQNNAVPLSKLATGGITDANKIYSTSASGSPQLEPRATIISGVTAGGDLSGNYPSPKVGKLQGNTVNNAALSGTDAGKVLVWNGTEWIPQAVPGVTPASEYLMIDPAEFTNLRKSDKKDNDNIIMFDDNSTYVTTIKTNDGAYIIAPLKIPHTARIEQITLYYYDFDISNIEFSVYRKSPTGVNQAIISTWSSFGLFPTIRSSTHTPIAGTEIIDNNSYSYRIVIKLDQSVNVTDSNDATMRVYAVKIQYLR